MLQVYWILDGILAGRCGPALHPWDATELYARGFRGVISLDEEGVDGGSIRAAGLAHLPLFQPMMLLMDDTQRQGFLECMPKVMDFVDCVRQHQGAVLVHCYHGCDRTGAVLACYLIARQGMTADQAIECLWQVQPSALAAYGYSEAVHLFEKNCQPLRIPPLRPEPPRK